MDEKLIKLFQQLSLLALILFVIAAAFNWNTPKTKVPKCSPKWNKGNNDQGKFGARFGPSGVTAPRAEGLAFFQAVVGPQTRY